MLASYMIMTSRPSKNAAQLLTYSRRSAVASRCQTSGVLQKMRALLLSLAISATVVSTAYPQANVDGDEFMKLNLGGDYKLIAVPGG